MIRKIFLIVAAGILLSSCIPTKDLVYFQGEPSSKDSVYKILNEPYRLQVNDIIDIRIKADDEKLVSVFNPINQLGNQTSNQFNEQNLYFTSYTIDRHGNIRIPYVGELNVLGYTEKEVREKVEIELAKVINYMTEYPNVKIDVRSHTDSRGKDAYNWALSNRRNESTRAYIIDKGGISSDRLSGQGYGETRLTNRCSNGVKCSKAEHQDNRRSEFIVVAN